MASKFTQWNRACLVVLILMDVHAAIKSVPARVVKPIYPLRDGSPRIFQVPGNWVDVGPSSSGHLHHHREVPCVLRKESRFEALGSRSRQVAGRLRRYVGIVDETIRSG